jgi:hypothetical protein
VLVPLAIANGAARERWLVPGLGEAGGHAVSSLVLAAAVVLVAFAATPWLRPGSRRRAWAVGCGWLAATLAFEFLAGRFVFGTPWPALLADYDVTRGRLWVVVLAATLLGPPLAWRVRCGVTVRA